MRSHPFLVSFFQIGELSLSLGVLGPCYTLKIMLSPTRRFRGKRSLRIWRVQFLSSIPYSAKFLREFKNLKDPKF